MYMQREKKLYYSAIIGEHKRNTFFFHYKGVLGSNNCLIFIFFLSCLSLNLAFSSKYSTHQKVKIFYSKAPEFIKVHKFISSSFYCRRIFMSQHQYIHMCFTCLHLHEYSIQQSYCVMQCISLSSLYLKTFCRKVKIFLEICLITEQIHEVHIVTPYQSKFVFSNVQLSL